MRILLATLVLAMLAPSVGTASAESMMLLLQPSDEGVHIVWSPVPGTYRYAVYKQVAESDPVLLGETPTPHFYDDTATEGEVATYLVLAHTRDGVEHIHEAKTSKTQCVSHSGYAVGVTFGNCVRMVTGGQQALA